MIEERDRPETVMVITPQMIEAGVEAFDHFSGSYDPWMLVRAIYTAMCEEERKNDRPGI
jgi:hypothetical protein